MMDRDCESFTAHLIIINDLFVIKFDGSPNVTR